MSTLQHIQNLHPSQQVANFDENEILGAVACTNRGCHLTFTWCPSHSGICSNQLADVAAKEGTTVEQEGVSHHYDSAKAAIRQATKEPTITFERVRHIYGERGENFESLHQQIEERPSPGPEILAPKDRQSARYHLPKIRYGGGR